MFNGIEFTWEELQPVFVSIQLAVLTTIFLVILVTPLAWWLSRKKTTARSVISSIVTLPLVLPPTVLGFYMLVFMGPNGPLGKLTESLGIGLLTFTFPGLLIGSMVYSLPFMIQPLQNSFEALGPARGKWPQRWAQRRSARSSESLFRSANLDSLPVLFSPSRTPSANSVSY